MAHDHEEDSTLQSPAERRSLLSQGMLRLRRFFVQVANITTLRTDTITERTPDAGVTTTSLWNFIASGLGGLTDYDLTVGDVATPDYGLIRIGNSVIGRTSYNVGDMDVDGAFILRNVGGPVTGQIEFCFTESGGNAIRFALPKSGAGNATYNPRSMLLAGPAVNNDDVVTVAYWQTNNSIFDNLACDTAGDGADLGVQNDLEVEGDIFTDSIKESTAAAGVTIDSVLLKDDGIQVGSFLNLSASTELTIATGVITVTKSYHTVDTESDVGSDALDTINGGTAGDLLIIKAENGARTVIVKHATGNILNRGNADINLDDVHDAVWLIFDGTNWNTH